MCQVVEGSVTFTGPSGALRELQYRWDQLRTVHDMHLHPPEVQQFWELESMRSFDDPRAPATAKLRHHYGPDAPVAERLQIEMILGQLPILVEPEHHTGLSSGTPPPSAGQHPTITIDRYALNSVSTDASVGSASGGRVAVIDSGDLLGGNRMYDFTGGVAREAPADDQIGHGQRSLLSYVHSIRTPTPRRSEW